MNAHSSPGTPLSLIKQHPVAAFLAIVLTLSWTGQILSILLLGNILPGILAELLILLGTSILVTGVADGRPAVRELFRRAFRWRVSPAWYVAAILALPLLTALIAAATGTFHPPSDGWALLAGNYLLNTLIIGALLGNIWEELAWTGVVQHRIMDRRGPVVAALLTAIPFALIHLPFVFAEKGFGGTPWTDVAVAWAVLFLFAPFFRLLMGAAYLGTGYSLLIVGLLHASFNASAETKLDVTASGSRLPPWSSCWGLLPRPVRHGGPIPGRQRPNWHWSQLCSSGASARVGPTFSNYLSRIPL